MGMVGNRGNRAVDFQTTLSFCQWTATPMGPGTLRENGACQTVTEKIGKFKLPGPVYIAEKLKNRKKSENSGNNQKVSERCCWRLPNSAGPVTPPAASSISKTANRALNRALNRASAHCLLVHYFICHGWGWLGIVGIVRWICRQPCPFAG